MNDILAKSKEYVGTLLLDYLNHVKKAAYVISKGIGCDENEIRLAEQAALLHDIGKAHTEFQKILHSGNILSNSTIPLRHEIASLLFLPAFTVSDWNAFIEYVVAHHKSIGDTESDNYGDKGLVFLCSHYTKTKVFNRHVAHWKRKQERRLKYLSQERICIIKKNIFSELLNMVIIR